MGSGSRVSEQFMQSLSTHDAILSGSLSHQYLSYYAPNPVENGSPVVSRTPIRLSNIFRIVCSNADRH
jgi:hypothetical protein